MSQLQIDQMTLEEKLRIMEAIWDDLRTRAEGVPTPQWHKDLLDERERLIETGKAQFDDWDAARKRITEQTS
ncbi:MAG: addiction module protein [Pyrinomonadaceae bacterium]